MHNHEVQQIVYIEERPFSTYFWQVCYHIAYVLISLIWLTISVKSFNSLQPYEKYLHKVKNDWDKLPLIDIKTDSFEWPDNYENLITRNWPGTVEGWDWSNSSRNCKYANTYIGACTPRLIYLGCHKISPNDPILLKKFYSKQVWGLRQGQSFINITRPIYNKEHSPEWPSNYKIWGTGRLDTMTWVKNDDKWPINGIYIVNEADSYSQDYTALDLDNGLKLIYTTQGTQLPIVDLRLTEGRVWANPSFYEKSQNRTLHILINTEKYDTWDTKVSNYTYDPEYTMIGSIQEDRLFRDNGIDKVVAELPNYDVESGKAYSWNLYYKSYDYWNINSEFGNQISWTSMISSIKKSSTITDFHANLMIVCTLQVFICCVMIGVTLLLTPCKGASNKAKRVGSAMIIVLQILFGLQEVFLFWIWFSISLDNGQTFLKIKEQNYFSDYTNNVLNEFALCLLESARNSFEGFILSLWTIFLILIFLHKLQPGLNRYDNLSF